MNWNAFHVIASASLLTVIVGASRAEVQSSLLDPLRPRAPLSMPNEPLHSTWPAWDIQEECSWMLESGRKRCEEQEGQAKRELAKNWNSLPDAYRETCLRRAQGPGGRYGRALTCAESLTRRSQRLEAQWNSLFGK